MGSSARLPLPLALVFALLFLAAGCWGGDDSGGPPANPAPPSDVVPRMWAGIWKWDIHLDPCDGSGDTLTVTDYDTLCAGEAMSSHSTTVSFVDHTFSIHGQDVYAFSECDMTQSIELTLTCAEDEKSATGTGRTFIDVEGACPGWTDECYDFAIDGVRMSVIQPGCGSRVPGSGLSGAVLQRTSTRRIVSSRPSADSRAR